MSTSIIKRKEFRPILDAPNLRDIIDELEKFWKEEQNRRLDFYNWVTPNIKAEFIDGEIVVHSPVRKSHNDCGLNLVTILKLFILRKKVGWLGYEKVMTRFTRNDYEPDICFFSNEKSKDFIDEQTIFPVPDFIVEILSKSTEDRDRGIKKLDYQLHKVKEYWIVDPDTALIEQYLLDNEEQYGEPNIFNIDQSIDCKVIDELSIPLQAIFNEKAHSAFVENLF